MDNGKRATQFILKNVSGTTMIEIVVTVALAGIVIVGLLMITQSKDSFLKDSSTQYDSVTNLMVPVKKLKRDIALASKIKFNANQELEIQTSVFRNDKLEEYTIAYKNSNCSLDNWGKGFAMKPKSSSFNKKKVSNIKTIPCLIRTNKSSNPPHVETFLGINTARFCKGGSDFIGNCIKMKTDMPEEYQTPGLKNSDISERRFMAEFIDRTNRTIAFTVDLGNLYDETLRDKVQITR